MEQEITRKKKKILQKIYDLKKITADLKGEVLGTYDKWVKAEEGTNAEKMADKQAKKAVEKMAWEEVIARAKAAGIKPPGGRLLSSSSRWDKWREESCLDNVETAEQAVLEAHNRRQRPRRKWFG